MYSNMESQRAKKVGSDSPGLVDFAIRLVNSVFNLPDGQVTFFEEFKYRIYPCIMRTFFTTFEAEKLRCALYTEPFVSEALLICINKRNNSRWLFPGLLL